MSYTVKELAKISGVTERTLRWYDKIDLLKPSYRGNNGYRYYEEKQMLLLQQILYFRNLDIPLNEVREILYGNDFDIQRALKGHKRILELRLEKVKALIGTIDKTLLHLKDKIRMKDDEMYKGFNEWSAGKGMESYFLGFYNEAEASEAEKTVMNHLRKQDESTKDPSFYESHEQKATEIYLEIASCIDEGIKPDDPEVQELMKKHHSMTDIYHVANREVYESLAKLYLEKEEFILQLRRFHIDMNKYLSVGMQIFAKKNL